MFDSTPHRRARRLAVAVAALPALIGMAGTAPAAGATLACGAAVAADTVLTPM